MKNLISMLDGELADDRTTLGAASFDIAAAASFCSENYLKGSTEGKLENTMTVATQSLGTVAFHISTLANHFLEAVALQSDMLVDITDRLQKLQMLYNIHQEKVSRKAIGACADTKVTVVYPHDALPELQQKYIRRPIDFSVLESIGHGVRMQEPVLNDFNIPASADATIYRKISGTATPMHGPLGRQMSTVSGRSANSEDYAASLYFSGTLRQSGTMGRTAGVYRSHAVPPQLMYGPVNLTNSANSGSGSPVAGTPSHYGSRAMAMPQNLQNIENVAANATWSSGYGSGPLAVGSNAQITGQYAVNQQLCQPFTPQRTVNNIPQKIPGAGVALDQPIQRRPNQNFAVALQPPQLFSTGVRPVSASSSQSVFATPQTHYAQQYQDPIKSASKNSHYHGGDYPDLNKANFDQVKATVSGMTADGDDQMPLPPPEAYAGLSSTAGQDITIVTELPAPMHSSVGTRHSIHSGSLTARKAEDPDWAPDFYIEKVVTLYEYVRDKDDELTFSENQVIFVLKKNDDGWWEGIMDGITGLFPGNYVEVCQ